MFIVIDLKIVGDQIPNEAWLVGRFDSQEQVDKAIEKIEAHWENYQFGAEKDLHTQVYFSCESEVNEVCIPDYDSVEEDDDEDEEDEDEEDEEDEE